jgi:hypothetical protein
MQNMAEEDSEKTKEAADSIGDDDGSKLKKMTDMLTPPPPSETDLQSQKLKEEEEDANKQKDLSERRSREDSILQKAAVARAAKANIAKAALPPLPSPPRNRTHWDYVMEEMQWLAYDVGQERRWKLTCCRSVVNAAASEIHKRREKAHQKAAAKKKKKQQHLAQDQEDPHSPLDHAFLWYDSRPFTTEIQVFFNQIQQNHGILLQNYRTNQISYEKKLEEFRIQTAKAAAVAASLKKKQKMQSIRQELDKTRRALAAAAMAASNKYNNSSDNDPLGNSLLFEKSKKGKRKGSKKNANSLLDPLNDPDSMLLDDYKPSKKMKLSSGELQPLDGLSTPGDLSLGKKKKKKGKKGKNSPGMDEFPGITSHKTKKGKKGMGSKPSKSSFLQKKLHGLGLPFGDAKMEISQVLLMSGTAIAGATGKTKTGKTKSGKTKSSSDKLISIHEVLKVQAKEGKGKKTGGSSKSSKKNSSANQGYDATDQPPWMIAEDQALLAIVHEFGSNWGVVADVLACTYALKDVYRRPHACRQRFKWICSTASGGHHQLGGSGGGKDDKDKDGTGTGKDDKESYAVALKVNRSNAKSFLHHVTPADEDGLKRHLDVVISVSSKHRTHRQAIEQQKSSKDMQLVDSHPSHKNAQALASRGQMLMNPGALCEYVNSNTYGNPGKPQAVDQMNSPNAAAPNAAPGGSSAPMGGVQQPPPPHLVGPGQGRSYSDVVGQQQRQAGGAPPGAGPAGQDASQAAQAVQQQQQQAAAANMQMVSSPRMQQQQNPMAGNPQASSSQPLISPRSTKGTTQQQQQMQQQQQQRYMMAYHHQQPQAHSMSMPAPGMNMNLPYGQLAAMSQPMATTAKKDGGSSGKGKSKKGSQKQQQGGDNVPMDSVPPVVNFLDRPPGMDVNHPVGHLDPHAPLSSGMHSLGSTMHMMQAPGRPGPYDGMPPGMANVPNQNPPGFPPNPKMTPDQFMQQHKPQPGMRM